ncbi:CrcB family protein [Mesobacillus subterraneus]|uniref:fluoride efflux transporter FluC n=1 Tax=Mesobacillus subterraneus TaxID=285983 RepID=UPI00273F0B7F|nr:CrcB family protein [Mesobacillus subterraneus]WLR56802.1 CrcB family protein [Mesobacillus subterraneus]
MVYLGVGLGGMLGSLLRYLVSLGTSDILHNGFPIGTLIANCGGSLFLGWFTARIIARRKLNPVLSATIGTGLTGSFTTFSTFSIETLVMVENGTIWMAIFYVHISAVGGLILAAAGYKLGAGLGRGGITMIGFVLVALGGMAGALSRFVIQMITGQSVLPVATLTVNLLGSFLLGWIVGQGIQGNLYLFAATGFMGAFTTFSTLNVDLVKLINSRENKAVVVYVASTYIGGLLSAAAGLIIGRLL